MSKALREQPRSLLALGSCAELMAPERSRDEDRSGLQSPHGSHRQRPGQRPLAGLAVGKSAVSPVWLRGAHSAQN